MPRQYRPPLPGPGFTGLLGALPAASEMVAAGAVEDGNREIGALRGGVFEGVAPSWPKLGS